MRRGSGIGLIALCALLCANTSAGAQTSASEIASLSSQLNSANAEKASALSAISQADSDAAPKTKEVNLWNGEMNKIKPEVDYFVQKKQRHDNDAAVVNGKVHTHNAGCTGTLPRPQYERCKGEESYLQPQIDRINNEKRALDSERDTLMRRVNNIEARRDALVNDLKQIESRREAAMSRLKEAERRINLITGRLRTACNEGQSPEGLAYCGQVDWDGARSGLQAPNLQPRPFTATPR